MVEILPKSALEINGLYIGMDDTHDYDNKFDIKKLRRVDEYEALQKEVMKRSMEERNSVESEAEEKRMNVNDDNGKVELQESEIEIEEIFQKSEDEEEDAEDEEDKEEKVTIETRQLHEENEKVKKGEIKSNYHQSSSSSTKVPCRYIGSERVKNAKPSSPIKAGKDPPRIQNLEDSARIEPLITLKGTIFGEGKNFDDIIILKDDGCNTNVISKDFYLKNQKNLPIPQSSDLTMHHSHPKSTESYIQVIPDLSVKIGDHTYQSSFVISQANYPMRLGMPWHKETLPVIDYEASTGEVEGKLLTGTFEDTTHARIQNMSVKRLRGLCRKRRDKHNNWTTHLPMAELSYASSEHGYLGCSPFKADIGYNPKSRKHLWTPSQEPLIVSRTKWKERVA